MTSGVEEDPDLGPAFDLITVSAIDLNAWQHGNILELGFLNPLRESISSFFMPNSLWLRQEMIDTIHHEIRQNSQKFQRQVLIGSPGVGKSVLFFLYALVYATDNRGKKVMYWRKALADTSKIDLLCIEASTDQQVQIRWNKVPIPFLANIEDIYIAWMQVAYPTFFQGAANMTNSSFTLFC